MKTILKRIYALLPFKQGVFRSIRSVWTPPRSIYKHLHFTGTITVQAGGGRAFKIVHHGFMIENELFWRGLDGWEGVSFELWKRLCRDEEVICDIGANTGVYALLARTINPKATVIAAEPVKRIYDKLCENVRLNDYNILTFQAAMSDRTGTATFYDMPGEEHVLSVSMEKDWNKGSAKLHAVQVPCSTVTDLLKRSGQARCGLFKIDVETHEPAVLRGFKELLERDKPTMLIEVLNERVAAEVTALIEGLGYSFYNIDDHAWPPRKVDTLSKSDHFNFLICRPEVAQKIGLERPQKSHSVPQRAE